jgi:hypothetical protein
MFIDSYEDGELVQKARSSTHPKKRKYNKGKNKYAYL